jgi:predicted metal-dependent enzyme (double-stranded beta helix superfamily)
MGESCVPTSVDGFLARLRSEHEQGRVLDVERLATALAGVVEEEWIAGACFDEAVPYGRTVLLADDGLEVMIAGWSRGRPCAPHDHGPGQGAVRVLQGRARHRGFVLEGGELQAGADELLRVGDVLRCHKGWIHQMQDDGDRKPLVTLHLYSGPTVPMTVYDLERRCTQWLGPGCGAWPRPSGDPEVLVQGPGLLRSSVGRSTDERDGAV